MKLSIVLALLVVLAGCGKAKPFPATVGTHENNSMDMSPPIQLAPPEPKFESDLRSEAKSLRLNWKVYCMGDDFYGVAWPYGGQDTPFIEDGSQGLWIVEENTQKEAAIELTQAIRRKSGQNWFAARHKEPQSREHHKMCPPELSGGESQP